MKIHKRIKEELKNVVEEYKTMTLKEIAKLHNCDHRTVSNYLKRENIYISKHNKSNLNNNIFKKIDNEEKAYWLGFLYADGCILNNNKLELSLQQNDKVHLEKFKKFLQWDGTLTYNKKSKSWRVALMDKTIVQDLVNLGCTRKKSLTLTFPDLTIVPKLYQRHFIRGYFDGDGTISLNYYKTVNRFTGNCSVVGTRDFIYKMYLILLEDTDNSKYNFRERIPKNPKHSSLYFIDSFASKNRFGFLKYLYFNTNIYLDRKFDNYRKIAVLDSDI